MNTTIDTARIKELVKDDHLKNCLHSMLDLIMCVEMNYSHIDQLETLKKLFEGGLAGYYKEYHPNQEFLTIQCGIIAENTRANHYREDKLPDIHSLYEELLGRVSSIRPFKDDYYRLTE